MPIHIGDLFGVKSPCNPEKIGTQPIIELFSPDKRWTNSKCECARLVEYNFLFSK